MIDDFNLTLLVEPLQQWFTEHARTLPWRSEPTPYHVWISEIMLQQTRVEAVKPYYARFMKELPSVKDLAECSEDRYLKLWEGLGYYSRVRNLHAAAVQIMEEHGGNIPDDYQKLLKLKGIGSYTAGAISSMAFGIPVAAVDGNVLRVISRVTGDDSDIMKPQVKAHMEQVLTGLMREQQSVDPRIFNQALMELGATVCLPNGEPHCGDCPWSDMCIARREDRTGCLPVKNKAKSRRIEERTVLILKDGERVAIRKRPGKGLLAGLYELPNCLGHLSPEQALHYMEDRGFRPLRIQKLEPAKHIFSHVEWHMIGYVIWIEEKDFAADSQREKAQKEQLLFVEAADAREHYAIPSAFGAYARHMNIKE